jgi:hypothetical protein
MFSNRHSLAGLMVRHTFFLALLVALSVAAFAQVPIISFLTPASANPGGTDITLTVNGANFINAFSVVNWDGTPLVTTFVSSTKLTATVPEALIASGGTGWITVSTVSCGDCSVSSPRISNVFYFPVQNPIPTYTAVELTATVGTTPFQLVEADFNADGKLDLAVGNYSSNTVSILLGNGDGTFQTQQTFPTLARPFGIAVGDLNGDGIPDLVVGNDSTGLNIFLGDGSGGFTAGTSLIGGSCPLEPVLADINQDGNLDIVVGNECGSGIEVYLGNGNGTFGSATLVSGSTQVFGLVLADFNGDGILDIAGGAYGSNDLDIYFGVGNGTFGAVTHMSLAGVVSVAADDVNGDGYIDLITASQSGGGIKVLYGNGNGTFQTPVAVAAGSYFSAETGDLNGDGNRDIVGLTTSGSIQVWFASAGGFQAPESIGSASSYRLALGNFATAGGLDIVSGNASTGQVDILLPTVIISPSSKNFGSIGVGQSAQQIFTLTNDTANMVAISGIAFTGANPGDFSQINTCSSPLAPTATCTVSVTFAPAATGARAATLTVTDDAPDSPQTALLTGTGAVAPIAMLSTTTLAFGSETLHVTTVSQPVTLTNTGNASLTGIAISITGTNSADFGQTNNCPATLTVISTCTVNVTFTPSVLGAESALLSFSDNAVGSPQLVSLSGTGSGVPTKLNYITAPPAMVVAGSSIGAISVGVYDVNSLLVANSNASITVALSGPNSFSQSQIVVATAGIATFDFSGVPLDVAGQYSVTASSVGLSSAVGTTSVTPLFSSELMIVAGYPSPSYANVPHAFTVSVTDSFGNSIPSYTGTVTLASSDPAALLTPTPYTFVSADMGTHTFTATLSTVGTQSIAATDGTLTGMQAILVNPRPQLVVNLLPDDAGAFSSACDGSVPCSLRSAINQANTLGAGDLTVDTSQFSGAAPWTSTLTNGVLELNSNISITGPGETQLSLSGNNVSSVFQVDVGAIATISSLSATEGNSTGSGGGITNAGSLTLTNVAVTNNIAAEDGGGIYNSGSLTVNSSALSGNTATGNGGGAATTGTSVFYDSTLSANTASGNGGGIDNSGALSIPQSTFYGNTAVDGAGIENQAAGTLVMAQSTLSGNVASSETGGTITNQNEVQSAVTILNSVVAGNTALGGDCVSCGVQVSFNLFDVSAATLKLGTLATNGGPTETLLPLIGSPAIGGGSVALATDSGLPQSLVNDQRGLGYARVVNNSVDLGAVQYNSGPPSSITLVVSGSPVAGTALTATLNALTASGNPDEAYNGTIHFTSSDAHAVLAADYTFAPSDNGTHVFAVTLQTSGSQSVTAADTVTSSLQATQTITESPAAAATVTVNAGFGQTAPEGAAFATALSAKVSDAFGNAVPAATVLFTAPSSGASGTFAGSGNGSGASVATDSNGVATAPAFTANSTTGQYSVSAAVQGLTPVAFALTNVALPDYSITASPTSLTIVQGQSGSTALTITPVGGMSGTVSFACTGLPGKASCVFVPSQVAMTGDDAVQTVTLTVNTTGANGMISEVRPESLPTNRTGFSAFPLLPAGLLFLALPVAISGWRKNGNRQQHCLCLTLMLLLGAFTAIGMTACSGVSSPGGGGGGGGTPAGQYSVSAGATVSGSNSHSALVTITITQ